MTDQLLEDIFEDMRSGTAGDAKPGFVISPPTTASDAEPIHTVGHINAYRADALRPWADEGVDWRIPHVMAKGAFGVVGGPKKSLKSSLTSGYLALSLANATPWLGNPDLKPAGQASVLVVINEGLKPYMRTLFRLAATAGLDTVGDITVIPAVGVRLDDGDLAGVIREWADMATDPVIFYDATYGFVGGDTKAESLFAMNDVLAVAQTTGAEVGADVWLVHHYTKRTKGRPDLDDLSWAGFGEWVDSWMLLTHREKPKADEGLFKLGLVAGSRQGFETLYEIDADLGVLSRDGTFDKLPEFTARRVSQGDSEQWGKNGQGSDNGLSKTLTALTDLLSGEPWAYTKSQILPKLSSEHRGEAFALHEKNGIIESRIVEYEGSDGRKIAKKVWGMRGES